MEVLWKLVMIHRTMKRATLSLGRRSLELLEVYFNGAICYYMRLENKDIDFLPGFDEYIQKRFNVQEKKSFYKIIREQSVDDEDAFWNFYDWMYDFLAEMGSDYEPVVERDYRISDQKSSDVICKIEISTS